MKKTLLLAALIGCTCLTQAQDTFIETPDHKQPVAEDWKGVKNIRAAWGTSDIRYAWHSMPDVANLAKSETLTAWRGERVSTQAVIYSGVATDSLAPISFELSAFKSGRNVLPADAVKASFVRYVKTDSWNRADNGKGGGCGHRPDHTVYDSTMVADIIDPHAESIAMDAMSTRSVWVSCQVPADAAPGVYSGTLCIKAGKRSVAKLPLQVRVLEHTLPAPKDWAFHLDLWQNPFTEARYYNTPLWSEAHLEAMRPSMEMLAAAGQKVITTSIMHKPWNGQTQDHFDSMVTWIKNLDGSWSFGFDVFDRWVEFMMSCGIDKQINCYSMIPWALNFPYYDVATNRMQTVKAAPGDAAYGYDHCKDRSEKGLYQCAGVHCLAGAIGGHSAAGTAGAAVTMFYGNPHCCELDLFSNYEISILEERFADQGMLGIAGDVQLGADVVVDKGFIVVKKSA